MKNMNDKTKKRLVVAGGLAVGAVLIAMISGQFKTAPVNDVEIPHESSDEQNVVVETPNITEKENDITVPDIEIPKETENPNGDDTGTEQTIQPDIPEKPTYTEEELTNPNQKPNGEKVDPPTSENPKPPQTQEKLQEKQQEKTTNPTGGLPGFDNVPNMGENQTIIADDMYENGNKVGIMD